MSEFTHIVCPHCDGTNRIPSGTVPKEAKCGRCKQSILDTKPIELTTQNIQQHLEKNDIPVIIDFWAPWCGPCKMMGPNFEQASHNFRGEVRFAKVNTEDQQSLGAQFNIRSIPTLMPFKKAQTAQIIARTVKDKPMTNRLQALV